MENIKDNSNETVELNNEELEKVAGGEELPHGYICLGCGRFFPFPSMTMKNL